MPKWQIPWSQAALIAAMSAVVSGLFLFLGTFSGYINLIYPGLESRPFDSKLVVRFSRLPVGRNTAQVMKLAEGAVFEFSPEWSHEEIKQYWITDGITKFGLADKTMLELWKRNELNGMRPVATPLWGTISGNDDAILSLSMLSFVASLSQKYDPNSMTKVYGCYEAKLLDQFDCFCPNQPLERSARSILGVTDDFPMCTRSGREPFDFFFTLMSIENEGTHPVKKLQMTFRDTSIDRLGWVENADSIFRKCNLEDDPQSTDFPIGLLHTCIHQFLQNLADDDVERSKKEILTASNLAPGEKIFLLLNAYIPDDDGLPIHYLIGHLQIDRLDYLEGVFELSDP